MILGVFAACYFVPWHHAILQRSWLEALMMLQEYAREHVLTCLIPAFFIAGAIGVFVSQASVLKYFGSSASKLLTYFHEDHYDVKATALERATVRLWIDSSAVYAGTYAALGC